MDQAKPLFRGEFSAFSEFDRQALTVLLKSISKPFKRILEVGSWLGNGSTRTIVEEIRGHGVLYCVDHWQGNANVARHQELSAQYDIFATFRANVASWGSAALVKPLMMSSQEAAFLLRDHVFDLVFLDGDHSYQQTLKDIAWWLPKVAPEGILCGHDCEGRAENYNNDLLWQHGHEDSVPGNGRFARIHPGPILAVAEKFGNAARLFAEEPVRMDDGREGYSTIWAWQKSRVGIGIRFLNWFHGGGSRAEWALLDSNQ
jgi:predicted O-methyltransferase YrrM